MKKYLSAITASVIALTASATPFSVAEKIQLHPEACPDLIEVEAPIVVNAQKTIPSRSENSEDEIYYTLAGDPYGALSLNNQTLGTQVAMAFQIEPSFLSSITEGEITEISYYTGGNNTTGTNNITKATVFITSALDGEFLYTQTTTAPATPYSKVDVKLDTPFDLSKDLNKVYVGVYFTVTGPQDAGIVVDNMGHSTTYGGWYASRSSSKAQWSWYNLSQYYGFVTVGAKIKSPDLPKNSVSLVAIDGQPVASQYTPFGFDFLMQNNGANEINNLTIEYSIEGEDAITEDVEVEQSWGFNESRVFGVSDFVAKNATKKSDITVKVTAVNGQPNNSDMASGSYSVVIVPEGKGLPRNVVIEEFTSTSCVYCPVGYTAMEKIHEEYPDGSIIPVCVHVNTPGSDPMTATSYGNLFNRYSSNGVPFTVVNRNYGVALTDYKSNQLYDELIETATHVMELPGVAQVTAEGTLNAETRTLTVNSKMSFAFDYDDGDKNFILAYGVTENEVGPYKQQNGYSGQAGTVIGGWNKKPTTVELVYNDVARQLDRYSGITGSVPAAITAGETYEYSHDINLVQAINDLEKINVIVYLINRKTSQIENACQLKNIGNGNFAGIESVIADDDNSDAPVEYYNLQGVRVNDPANGLFIRRQGNNVSKVLVK